MIQNKNPHERVFIFYLMYFEISSNLLLNKMARLSASHLYGGEGTRINLKV